MEVKIKKKRIQRHPRKPRPITPKNLLINKRPELVPLWDKDKNKNIDINTISYASTKKVAWLCPAGKKRSCL